MRTTLEIDDGVMVAARALAQDRGISIGAAVSELALVGLRSRQPRPTAGATDLVFPTFDVDVDAPPITLELVNEHRDD